MFRIDDPSAATVLPSPSAAGSEGYFTEGDPSVSTPATLVRADWLNAVQEELRAIVVAGGLTPSKTTLNQVLQAIQNLINPGQSLTTNGYKKFPGGLILQWGAAVSSSSSSGTSVSFPIAFPSVAFAPFCTTAGATNATTYPVIAIGATTTTSGFVFFSTITPATPGSSTAGISIVWLALGY